MARPFRHQLRDREGKEEARTRATGWRSRFLRLLHPPSSPSSLRLLCASALRTPGQRPCLWIRWRGGPVWPGLAPATEQKKTGTVLQQPRFGPNPSAPRYPAVPCCSTPPLIPRRLRAFPSPLALELVPYPRPCDPVSARSHQTPSPTM